MKPALLLTIVTAILTQSGLAQTSGTFRPLSYEEADQKADSILALMTLDEKLRYIGGDRFFFTQEIDRLEIPAVAFVDATQGVRINPRLVNKGWKKTVDKTLAYPSPILLASTWNIDLAYEYARSIGEECRASGFPVLLGPGMNLYRNAQCGRNFEYFGEDPHLSGIMVAQFVRGLQSTGTMATLKHFIANQTDYYRKKSNSVLDERTLHEVYMPAFRYGIDAGAKAVMTSYNLVNGEWAGQSDYVINQLLREELGFRWLVMTDWFSVWDGEKVIHSGQDLEMPYRKAVRNAERLLKENKISEDDIDRMVKSILRSFMAMNAFHREKHPLSENDYNRLEEVALNTAREGIVLLRNEDQLLPLDKSKKQKILVTGEYLDILLRGGGAARVKGYDIVMLKDALLAEFDDQLQFVKDPTSGQLQEADIVILSVGTEDREAVDRPFDLSLKQEEQVQFCSGNNPNTIVIVNSGGGINMSNWENVPVILYSWYMGQNGATALAGILCGKTNPSGKLPVTIEKYFEDSPAYGYLPEGEKLYSRFKWNAEKRHAVYDVHYREGIFVGYRWYEHMKIKPMFCFGHGLSYTSFEYTDLSLSAQRISKSENLEVTLNLKNTGKLDGAEIIQLYVSDKECSEERSLKELKGFAKIFLQAGESLKITLTLRPEDFAFWDPESKAWTVERGEFEILVGASSEDIRLRCNLTID